MKAHVLQRLGGWVLLLLAVVLLLAAAAGVAADRARDALDHTRREMHALDERLDAAAAARVRLQAELDAADRDRALMLRRLRRLGVRVDDLDGPRSSNPPPATSSSARPGTPDGVAPSPQPDPAPSPAPRDRDRRRRPPPDDDPPGRPGNPSPSPSPTPCTVDLGPIKVCP